MDSQDKSRSRKGRRGWRVVQVLRPEPAPARVNLAPPQRRITQRGRVVFGFLAVRIFSAAGGRCAVRRRLWRGRRTRGEGAGGAAQARADTGSSPAASAWGSVRRCWGAGVAVGSAPNEGPTAAQILRQRPAHTPLRGYATLPSLHTAALTLPPPAHAHRLCNMAANAKEGIGRQRKRLSVVSGNSLIDGLAAAAIEDSAVS